MRKILAIGAHPDDIEIGCAGSVAKHVANGDEVYFLIMSIDHKSTDGATDVRKNESINAAQILGVKKVFHIGYADADVPNNSDSIKKIEDILNEIKPQRVYIPYMEEIHQDHRNTHYSAISACRNISQILMYEGPSTASSFQASFCIDIEKFVDLKIKSIEAHVSQGHKLILRMDLIIGMNKFRGYQARCLCAEAFSVFRFLE